ncbi:MAG: alcohol dehydrogenase [Anaerolineaceae bacterium]|nr:alcohol dehydrogenase [Anaerolineaceae bacterium]|tara:strand:- start:165 stop:1238 length:1074 start_codon:yes stop_codon:yes gene_type:complete
MIGDLSALCVSEDSTIRQVIACLERNTAKIALVVNDDTQLLNTVTDGDVRRAMLSGTDLDEPVKLLQERKLASSRYKQAVTAPLGTDTDELLQLMRERDVRQVPLVDDQQCVVGLVTLRELLPNDTLPIQAVVMAGGSGTRLRPLTENLPKPMVPVGGRPMLERIIEQLRDAGVSRVMVTTHYKGELITNHFGDGKGFGVNISYVEEDKPMGTAGGLSQLEPSDEPILVINGDILTRVDFRAMLDFHIEHKAEMSVAVRRHETQVPYGVIETEDERITQVLEKPVVNHFINAGIYLLNPAVFELIPENDSYDMPELINSLINDGRTVISFPVREYWLDIGQHKDYMRAEEDVRKGKA